MKKFLGVFGSAFNPVHFGHIDCLRQIDGQYEEIVVVPSYAHAFGKQMADFDIRVNSVCMAVQEAGNFKSHVTVSPIEKELAQKGNAKAVFTYDVLAALSERYGSDDIEFIVGPDNADPAQWSRFYRAEDIIERWGVHAVSQRLPIRSTDIRKSVLLGKSINEYVPATVIGSIERHKLYGV